MSNQPLFFYSAIGISLVFGLFLFYYLNAYAPENSLKQVIKLVDQSVNTGTGTTNSLMNSMSNRDPKTFLSSLSTKNDLRALESDGNKIADNILSDPKLNFEIDTPSVNPNDLGLIIAFDASRSKDPLSVALLTGGKNFEPTVHSINDLDLPQKIYGREEFESTFVNFLTKLNND